MSVSSGTPRLSFDLHRESGFILDAWYAVAFSHEVGSHRPLARKCCGENIALFRDSRGQGFAVSDRCPHRGLPLSLGHVVGDHVRCLYHGFDFNGKGECVCIPTQSKIPSGMRLRTFPMIERGQFMWVWPGAPSGATSDRLPDHWDLGLERPGWSAFPCFMHEIKAHYVLLFDNLLDMTHISYLHGHPVPEGELERTNFSTEYGKDWVRLRRTWRDCRLGEDDAERFGLPPGTRYDRSLVSEARLPNLHIMRNEFTFPDLPDHPGHIRINVKPVTPATMQSHYHFVTITSSFPDAMPVERRGDIDSVFGQDVTALEAIQQSLNETPAAGPDISVAADAAGLRARHILAGLLRAELNAEPH